MCFHFEGRHMKSFLITYQLFFHQNKHNNKVIFGIYYFTTRKSLSATVIASIGTWLSCIIACKETFK